MLERFVWKRAWGGGERGGLEVGVIIVSMHRILVQNSKSKDKINK